MKNLPRLRYSASFCIVLMFAALLLSSRAAVTEAWVQRHGQSPDFARGVVVDRGGNVVVTGFSNYDFYTAKYGGVDGSLLWERTYNGPTNANDIAQAVALDSDGNVIVTGWSNNSLDLGAFDFDYYTAKYASTNGAMLWEKRFSRPGNSLDIPTAVVVDGSNNVIVTGSAGTLKYAGTNGVLMWEQHLYSGWALVVDKTNNVVVTGVYGTMKYAAADGALLWEQRTNAGLTVAVDHSGNIVMAGNPRSDFYTAKYAGGNGALLWEKRIINGGAIAVAIDASDNVLVTGFTNGVASDLYTAKYAATNGATLWEHGYNNPSNQRNVGHAVAVDAGENAVVTAWSENSGQPDCYTAKYAAADGALLWEKRFTDSAAPCTNCLALGPNGMTVIAGNKVPAFGPSSLTTIVYRETLPSIFADKVPTGIRLRLPGVTNHTYNIERAPNVTGPWITNAVLTASTNGIIEYIDTNAPPGSAFYRTSTGQ